MEKGKFYSIKIKQWKAKKAGILIDESDSWILINKIFGDYILDGYEFINKMHISFIERGSEEIFVEDVLSASNKIIRDSFNLPLETRDLLDFLNKKQIVFELSTKFEDSIYIGRICKILEKSICIKPMNADGQWLKDNYLFRIDSLRTVALGSDYLNSLVKYSQSLSE